MQSTLKRFGLRVRFRTSGLVVEQSADPHYGFEQNAKKRLGFSPADAKRMIGVLDEKNIMFK